VACAKSWADQQKELQIAGQKSQVTAGK